MTVGATGLLRVAAELIATLLLAIPAIWGALALKFQAPGGRRLRAFSAALWGAVCIVWVAALWRGRFASGLAGFGLAFGALLVWWRRLIPSNDRIWADDVAQMTNGTIDGNRVTLRNVRNFAWRTPTEYIARWETRCYDLERLVSVDMIMSYWSRRTIAHMLVSFGFEDGEHVAFSVEIRRRAARKLFGDRRLLQGVRTQRHRCRRTRRRAPAHQRARRGCLPVPRTDGCARHTLIVSGLCR